MNNKHKAVAWVCIFSTLLMGCYGTVLIDPTGSEKESIHAHDIKYVTLRDGTEYEFYNPPTIANDTLAGKGWYYGALWPESRQVALPMSHIAEITVSRYNPELTLWACVGVVVVLGLAAGIVDAQLVKGFLH
jgi:hypothetical protein